MILTLHRWLKRRAKQGFVAPMGVNVQEPVREPQYKPMQCLCGSGCLCMFPERIQWSARDSTVPVGTPILCMYIIIIIIILGVIQATYETTLL